MLPAFTWGWQPRKLRRFRPVLAEFYAQEPVPGRSQRSGWSSWLRSCMMSGSLLPCRLSMRTEMLHFAGHDNAGGKMAAQTGQRADPEQGRSNADESYH